MDTELQELLTKINNDPEFVNSLDEREVIEISQKLNPYRGSLSKCNTKFTCLSISNQRDRHIADLKMTSMIGFLYRAWTEYEGWFDVPDREKTAEYHEGMSIRKRIIKQFLDHIFEYNPDRHVAPGNWPNPSDTERPAGPITIAEENLFELNRAHAAVSAELEATRDKEASSTTTTTDNNAVGNDSTQQMVSPVADLQARLADIEQRTEYLKKIIASKHPKTVTEARLKKYRPVEVMNNFLPVPSWDVWEQWQRYEEQNYDALRSTSAALYSDKPDLEFLIQIHDTFDGPDAENRAKKYAADNAHNVMFPITTIQHSSWTFLGPFAENRKRLEFYSKDNTVLKAIHDRVLKDQDTAKELLKKRVSRHRRRDAARQAVRHGTRDTKGLEQYIKTTGAASGMQPVLSIEEQEEIDEQVLAIQRGELKPEDVYEDVDEDGCPNNAIIVPVLRASGKDIKMGKFYSQAYDPNGKAIASKSSQASSSNTQ